MIDIPTLTPELLDKIGQELGGCDFTDDNQTNFLSSAESCDVQAAPGNGKTTLLVAKLALLSRNWTSSAQGVCVISHTNAAREEVEKKLASHPSASAFLGYPHFIGTVTAFIDRFIALPYLRGLGWSIQRIDDDVFQTIALSRWQAKPALVSYAQRRNGINRHALISKYVPQLELANDFECLSNTAPESLKIRHRTRQPRAGNNTGNALEELKAEIVNAGFYRFGDMTALAFQALEKYPELIDRIRSRFPLVLLDEAQDTNGDQLALLNRIFSDGVAYQRLGDQNQTLYEDPELGEDDYWQPAEEAIPLNVTRRFGTEIANFASRLTVRSEQQIEGKPDEPSRLSLLLFDENSIEQVLPAYADEVIAHWGDELTTDPEIWAVASRHNLHRDTSGGWPKSLVDYCPTYRSGNGRSIKLNTLCGILRQASVAHNKHKPPSEIIDLVTSGIVDLLHLHGSEHISENSLTRSNLWRSLPSYRPDTPIRLRRLLRYNIIAGNVAWDQNNWDAFCAELRNILGIPHAGLNQTVVDFLRFDPEGVDEQQTQEGEENRHKTSYNGVEIKLGSIHSVKGRTVDAILVLESEVYRGRANNMRTQDLPLVLPQALGVAEVDFTNPVHKAAATNIFVATTRPRQVLCLAMRREALPDDLLEAACSQRWNIRDLTIKSES